MLSHRQKRWGSKRLQTCRQLLIYSKERNRPVQDQRDIQVNKGILALLVLTNGVNFLTVIPLITSNSIELMQHSFTLVAGNHVTMATTVVHPSSPLPDCHNDSPSVLELLGREDWMVHPVSQSLTLCGDGRGENFSTDMKEIGHHATWLLSVRTITMEGRSKIGSAAKNSSDSLGHLSGYANVRN